jgi:hypothetical protein
MSQKLKLLDGAIKTLRNAGIGSVVGTGLYGAANATFPEYLGQDAKTALERDGDKYEFDPSIGEKGGYRVKRGLLETLSDKFTGRESAIQERGKYNRQQDLLALPAIRDAVQLNPQFKKQIEGDGDEDIYIADANTVKDKDRLIRDITPLSDESRSDLFARNVGELRKIRKNLMQKDAADEITRTADLKYNLPQNREARRVANTDRMDILESRLADRQFQQIQSQNNFQLQMDQLGLANRRYDMEAARNERRDRRETLGILLQGLRNVQNNLVNY